MNDCVYLTFDGYCILHSVGGVREPCVEGPCKDERSTQRERRPIMTDQDKPRICQVLGVEVNEEWRATGNDLATYRINEDGDFEYAMPLYSRPGHGKWIGSDLAHLLDFINHPDRIIRKPRFTEEETADAKAAVRFYPSVATIHRAQSGNLLLADAENVFVARLPGDLFPSLRPGQAVKLEEIAYGSGHYG